jgi:uncharacterized repeat protein (TIGR01451 family)
MKKSFQSIKFQLCFLIIFFNFPVIGQSVDYNHQIIRLPSCDSSALFEIILFCDIQSVQNVEVNIDWKDGTDTTFNCVIDQVEMSFMISNPITISHYYQYLTILPSTISINYLNGNPTNIQDAYFETSCDNNGFFNYNGTEIGTELNVFNSWNFPNELPSSAEYIIENNNNIQFTVQADLFYNSISACPSVFPLSISVDSNWLNTGYVWYQDPVIIQDTLTFGLWSDYFSNPVSMMYGVDSINFNYFIISANAVPNLNSSLVDSSYANLNSDFGTLTFYLSRDYLSAPDTSIRIRIDNPNNAFTFNTANLKNPIVGNEYFEFQPKVGDHFLVSFYVEIIDVDSSQLSYGLNYINAYLLNSGNINVSDDSTTFIFNFWEPCLGNNSTTVDLQLTCSSYFYDSIYHYQPTIIKDACQAVPGVQVTIQHPIELSLDTNNLFFNNYSIVNDSTIFMTRDLSQYDFNNMIDLPFYFNGLPISLNNLNFSCSILCTLDTNGIETCGAQLDYNLCNQIDSLNFYTFINFDEESSVIQFTNTLNYLNCNTGDTLHASMQFPIGLSVLSNNLLNAVVNNGILTFDLVGINSFDVIFNINQNLYDQNLFFSLTYNNISDTNNLNNTSQNYYQMPPDYCAQFVNDIIVSTSFNSNLFHVELNNYNYRTICNNVVTQKVVYPSNLVPVTSNLLNPIIFGDTLTFEVPDTSFYTVIFNINQFISGSVDTFNIEFLLMTDTSYFDNIQDSVIVYYPMNLCDSIDVATNSHNAQLIAPTQTGTINVYSNVLNCNGQLQAIFELPNWITPDLSQLIGASYANNLLTVNSISNFGSFNEFSFPVTFPGTTPAGTSVIIPYTLFNVADNSLYNNSDTIYAIVLNSYDPNEKIANLPQLISPDEQDKFLYEIHFQNNGNFPAYNVTVRDTIDANLDLNTFQFLSSQHPCIVTIDSISREVVFHFPNIQLNAYDIDSIASKGQFNYSISELEGISNGITIQNTAYIYFDFNPPIVTNTTSNHNGYLNVEETHLSENLHVWPIPTSTKLFIDGMDNIDELYIISIDGSIIKSKVDFVNDSVDLSMIPSGMYFIKARKGFDIYFEKIIIQSN